MRKKERENSWRRVFTFNSRSLEQRGGREGEEEDRKAQGLTSRNITKICKYIERQAVERAAGGRVEVG